MFSGLNDYFYKGNLSFHQNVQTMQQQFHFCFFLFLMGLMSGLVKGQTFPALSQAQLDTMPCGKVIKLSDDPHCSSFFICIPEQVKKHKHEHHTEHVYVLEGEAEMVLGEKKFTVRKGDFFIIPQGTPHAVKVTSSIPLKVISVQSPQFDGSDRVWVQE
jgi:mannose-6-phosphate isomerase-like protein (cupin superfamily)